MNSGTKYDGLPTLCCSHCGSLLLPLGRKVIGKGFSPETGAKQEMIRQTLGCRKLFHSKVKYYSINYSIGYCKPGEWYEGEPGRVLNNEFYYYYP